MYTHNSAPPSPRAANDFPQRQRSPSSTSYYDYQRQEKKKTGPCPPACILVTAIFALIVAIIALVITVIIYIRFQNLFYDPVTNSYRADARIAPAGVFFNPGVGRPGNQPPLLPQPSQPLYQPYFLSNLLNNPVPPVGKK